MFVDQSNSKQYIMGESRDVYGKPITIQICLNVTSLDDESVEAFQQLMSLQEQGGES
jgi:hypothetical protein